jgi:virginiamycin B lyase
MVATGSIVTLADGTVFFTDAGPPKQTDPFPPPPDVLGRYVPSLGISMINLPKGFGEPAICRGPDGNLWVGAGGSASLLGHMTPSGQFLSTAISDILITSITAGPDNATWYAAGAGIIGRVGLDGTISRYPIPSVDPLPRGITSGPDGSLWFTEQFADKIGRITSSGVISEFALPNSGSSPAEIVSGFDGALWFTEFAGNRVGRISVTGEVREFAIPIADSSPLGIAAGPDGAIWFTMINAGLLGRITPAGEITTYDVPGVSPFSLATSPTGTLWVTERTSKIAEIRIPQSSPTLWLQGGRFQVSVSWSAENIGTSGVGQPATLTNDSGYFWFFSAPNIEITVKVVDGRPLNDHFWVFIGGMTNVHFSLVVHDVLTGTTKTYTNPQGQFLSLGDTGTF